MQLAKNIEKLKNLKVKNCNQLTVSRNLCHVTVTKSVHDILILDSSLREWVGDKQRALDLWNSRAVHSASSIQLCGIHKKNSHR